MRPSTVVLLAVAALANGSWALADAGRPAPDLPKAFAELTPAQRCAALARAIADDQHTAVDALFAADTPVDCTAGLGWTPLMHALSTGHEELALRLIERGARATTRAADGSTPLHVAAGSGALAAARRLADCGAEINAVETGGYTPLHRAADAGASEMVEFLIGRGALVNARTRKGWIPLHGAMAAGDLESVALLLATGADPDIAFPGQGAFIDTKVQAFVEDYRRRRLR